MPPATIDLRQPPRGRARERGFTVIELVVVMLIVAVLVAIAAPRFLGAKSSTYAKEAKAAGSAYAQAISQYQADNYNKHPSLPRTGPALKKGPIDLMGKPYLPAVPDAVTGGRVGVDLGRNCTNARQATGPVGSYGQVSICFGTPPNYAVRVATRTDPASNQWKICWQGRSARQPSC